MKRRGKKFWGIFALVAPVTGMFVVITAYGIFRMIAILSNSEFSDNNLFSLIDRVFSLFLKIFIALDVIALILGIPIGIVLLILAHDEKKKAQK